MVNHMGSLKGGHYTAIILSHKDKTWYKFDDVDVNKVTVNLIHVTRIQKLGNCDTKEMFHSRFCGGMAQIEEQPFEKNRTCKYVHLIPFLSSWDTVDEIISSHHHVHVVAIFISLSSECFKVALIRHEQEVVGRQGDLIKRPRTATTLNVWRVGYCFVKNKCLV